ncbi:hypothetical protein D9M72_558470 [compost metagenome]
MIDAVDLLFGEVLGHCGVDRLVRFEVMPQRFFQHDAHVGRLARVQAGACQLLADRHEQVRRGGEIAHHHFRLACQHLLRQRIEMRGHACVGLHVDNARAELVP